MRRRLRPLLMTTGLVLHPAAGVGAGDDVASPALAIYAAGAEAWAFSAEIGIPGPVGPMASHTLASIDNSPHAVGASGLADPGYLVRAAAGLMLGVPTPAYCESAHPEGPPEADCGAPGGGTGAAQIHTKSGENPDATSTATLGRVELPGDPTPFLTVETQSATSSAAAADETGVTARSVVTLQGISLAGGAVRIGALEVTRMSEADGTDAGLVSSTGVTLSGVTVAGQAVDPGADAVEALAAATREAFGDTLRITARRPVEERTSGGKLTGEASGIEVLWQPEPDRWARIALGYARTLVYAVPTSPGGLDGVPGGVGDAPAPPTADPPAASTAGDEGPEPGPVSVDVAAPPPSADRSFAPGEPSSPVTPPAEPVAPRGEETVPPDNLPVAGPPQGASAPAPAPFEFGSFPLQGVRWVSPFLVLAQMTTGSQAWWFLAALTPLLLAGWGRRRAASSSRRGR